MNTRVGFTISILGHLIFGFVLSSFVPKRQIDFGIQDGPIVVKLQKIAVAKRQKKLAPKKVNSSQPTQEAEPLEKPAIEEKEVVTELPPGFDSQIKKFVTPKYPMRAIRKSLEGKVMLSLLVNMEGVVERVDIITSSGYEILDSSAVKAAMLWSFKPMPKPLSLSKEIVFKLR